MSLYLLMGAVWDMFTEYAGRVAAWDGEVREANACDQTTVGGRRGRTWAAEPWRTVYLGGREEDPDERREGGKKPGALPGRACVSLGADEACVGKLSDMPEAWRVTDDAMERALSADDDIYTMRIVEDLMKEWGWDEGEREREVAGLREGLRQAGLYQGGMPPTRPLEVMGGVDKRPLHASTPMWQGSGGEDTHNDAINSDPVMRLFQRCHTLESAPGVEAPNGRRVRIDKSEQKVMDAAGTLQTWMARWVAASLHVAHHFTDAAACDASLVTEGDVTRVAVGVWDGVQPGGAFYPGWKGVEEGKVERGMMGAAVPGEWDITTAEMYAVEMLCCRLSMHGGEGMQ